jgi:uncharacterized protein (DUF427 family)
VPDYPAMIAAVDQVEPAPRRVRGMLGGEVVFDTTRALYVWEWPNYPWYYVPLEDVNGDLLVDEKHSQKRSRGMSWRYGLQVGEVTRPKAARLHSEDTIESLEGTMRFEWSALDAWFEEDEEIFVHPRNPYTRVDALRSTRQVRVELAGTVLAESAATVMVFETGLPTRYYFDRSAVNFERLEATDTATPCPYKGRTSQYWSVRAGGEVHADLAWSYDFPTRQLLPIAGLVAFYNEKVDVFVDGEQLPQPQTHFFK